MDPSQHPALAVWDPETNSDDVHDADILSRSNSVTAFGQTAGAFVAPPSPGGEHQGYTHQPITIPSTAFFDRQRPLTPPRYDQDKQIAGQGHWYDPRFIPAAVQPAPRRSSYVSPHVPSFAPDHVSTCQATEALHMLVGSSTQPHLVQQQQQPPQATPPIQLWPTDTRMVETQKKQATPPIQLWSTATIMVDEMTRKKQEIYRQKGEARRKSMLARKEKALQGSGAVSYTHL